MSKTRKTSPQKTKANKKAQKGGFWSARLRPNLSLGKFLKFFISPFAWRCYLVLSICFIAYVVYLDATIRSTFEGEKWQLPARVYARPLEIYTGLTLSSIELEAELKRLGYTAGSASHRGSYYRSGNAFTLKTRGHVFLDATEESVQASIRINNGTVAAVSDLAGRSIALIRLEPQEIGSIYPAHREDRILVKTEHVSPLLIAALVAVEDHRFYEHHGVSLTSIMRAAVQNFKNASVVQGGSTITQQLVKNYYLSRERSLRRKFTEAIMSILLEIHYDKEEIIEAYLNEVYLGQLGAKAIHGFGLAAQHYFNQSLDELSVDKLAMLVAIVRGPAYYDPWRYPERAIERRNRVLDILVQHDLLAHEDVVWAKSQGLNLGKQSRSQNEFPAYVDLVQRQLRQTYKQHDLESDGLRIYTSFDPQIQIHAEQALSNWLKQLGDENLEAAMIVTHPNTAEVLAVVAGKRTRFAGFNRVLDARRSIGSLVKPFVYLSALSADQGYTLASMVEDKAIDIPLANGDVWSPRNFDRKEHGEVPMVTALAKSYNQAVARVGNTIGVDRVAKTIEDSGLLDVSTSSHRANIVKVPSLYIGSLELTPFEVATMYQSLSMSGYVSPLKAIRSVQTVDNEPLQHFPFKIERKLDGKSVYLVEQALTQVGRFGTAQAAYRYLPSSVSFAAKTGTSNQQRDSWFAGYSGNLLAVVWVGKDDNSPTNYTGSSAALPVWGDFMRRSGVQTLQLTQPEGVVMKWIDWQTGKPVKASCTNAIALPFIQGSEPQGQTSCSK